MKRYFDKRFLDLAEEVDVFNEIAELKKNGLNSNSIVYYNDRNDKIFTKEDYDYYFSLIDIDCRSNFGENAIREKLNIGHKREITHDDIQEWINLIPDSDYVITDNEFENYFGYGQFMAELKERLCFVSFYLDDNFSGYYGSNYYDDYEEVKDEYLEITLKEAEKRIKQKLKDKDLLFKFEEFETDPLKRIADSLEKITSLLETIANK